MNECMQKQQAGRQRKVSTFTFLKAATKKTAPGMRASSEQNATLVVRCYGQWQVATTAKKGHP